MAFLDDAGLNVDTQDQVEAGYRQAFRDEFGARFDLASPLSLTGRAIPIISSTVVQLQQLAAETLSTINPDNAQGVVLDFIASLFGEERQGPRRATVAARLFGLPGFDASDRRCRYVRNSTIWRTPAGSVIGATGSVDVVLVADTAGTALTDGTSIEAFADGTDQWVIVDNNVSFTAVESVSDSTAGSDRQSAASLRNLIRLAGRSSGAGTEPGILRALTRVAGDDVRFDNNRGLTPNVNGVPGKSAEVVFDQGSIDEVAQAIYDSFDNTQWVGTTAATAYRRDDDGEIELSRPVEVRLTPADRIALVWEVEITTAGAETALPDDATSLVQGALATYTNSMLKIGFDALPLEGGAAVVNALPTGAVPDAGLTVKVGLKGGAPPAAAPYVISSRERATTDQAAQAARIVGSQVQPFNFFVGQNLDFAVDGGTPQSVTFALSDFAVISAATALEVATAINNRSSGVVAGSQDGALTLATSTAGASAQIEILASSTAALLATLGLSAATVFGSDGDITVTIT